MHLNISTLTRVCLRQEPAWIYDSIFLSKRKSSLRKANKLIKHPPTRTTVINCWFYEVLFYDVSRYQTFSLSPHPHSLLFFVCPELCKRQQQQRGNFYIVNIACFCSPCVIFDSLSCVFLSSRSGTAMLLFSVSPMTIIVDVEFSEWQKYPESRKQMLRAELFLSQFQITAIIFFVFGNSCHEFPFLAEFYKKCLKECSPCADECWAMCVFFIAAFFSAEAKDVSNSLCSYKGGNKTENFRLPFFFEKKK